VERLVIVAPNWLGDAVMALPAIADVRNGTRGVRLAVAARASVAPLFSLVGDVDDVITGAIAGYDTAILLPNSFHSAMQAARAGVRERWGYRTDWRGMLLTRAIDRPSGVHQIDSYQRLVSALGFANGTSTPRLQMSTAAREAGSGALARAGWDGKTPLVAIAPGAAYGSAKRWPPSAFADLVAGLAEDGVTAVMVGAAADRATAEDVTRALRGRATLIDVVGRTDIPALAGVLACCRAIAANDSGALHLGAALGVKALAAFGPTDERLSAPRGATVVSHDTWCRPCGLRECPLDHACMLGIPASAVLAETRKVL
jgi:heptosyltransferase-2